MINVTTRAGAAFGATALALLVAATLAAPAAAFTIKVQDGAGAPVAGFRWLVEEDNTTQTPPGVRTTLSVGTDIHKSYAPVLAEGHSDGDSATVTLGTAGRYYVSVLPDYGADGKARFGLSGRGVEPGQASVTVVCPAYPFPTTQISIFVFEDHAPINNAPDRPNERGLAGFSVILADAGGDVTLDAFGNPLGTTYMTNPDGSFMLDGDGAPMVHMAGTGVILSDANGEAVVKYLPPGKFGLQVVPPAGGNWIQTATIEGTPVIDAWVRARGPRLDVEGFGVGFYHTAFGFVDAAQLPWALSPPGGGNTIRGTVVNNHFARPPLVQGFHPGEPVSEAWVGLNSPASGLGLYAAPCDGSSSFVITGVPDGTYQLVHWDKALDQLFGFATVTVPAPVTGATDVDLGNVLSFRWFGRFKGKVFFDANENGFPDADEPGMPEQAVNLRFRDGTMYQSTLTDPAGEYEFAEVFPFFKWLVAEVDFLRFKATGATFAVDFGGAIPPTDPMTMNSWLLPTFGVLNPQPQAEINPNTGNNLSRTETGPVLTQAMHLFLGQSNVIDWGKQAYGPGDNGGISGIVYYATTRLEDDPRYAAADPWEPGIPRVQVALYRDVDADGVIDDLDGLGGPTLADVDNHPLGWAEGGARGPEDVDRNGNGTHDPGDALSIVWTDSWDDSNPTGSIYDQIPMLRGQPLKNGYDNFGTWNQVRPGVFDGGYAFGSYHPGGMFTGSPETSPLPSGTYVVGASTPPGYKLIRSQDRNVEFGDQYVPSPLVLPPPCVGDPYVVPAELSLFPGVASPLAGQTLPDADRKQVVVLEGRNVACDFYYFTDVPKAARVVGFVNNDLSAEFRAESPIRGEKSAPAWIPVAFRDWTGAVVARVYADEFGAYNALLPSTPSNNIPSPAGQAPNMLTLTLNDPFMPDSTDPTRTVLDPFYNPGYAIAQWTLHYQVGRTTYADTPIVAVAAFVGYPNSPLDVEPPDGSPVIARVSGPFGGPVVTGAGQQVTVVAVGPLAVPDPSFDPEAGGTSVVTRDFGFGSVAGKVTVGGVDMPIVSWSAGQVVIEVPAAFESGLLLLTRGDTQRTTRRGVTLHLRADMAGVTNVAEGSSIQAAIDAAAPGDLILVAPGVYQENVIMHKPVLLQGWGAYGCIIHAAPKTPTDLDLWHARMAALVPGYDRQSWAPKEAPGIMVLGLTGAPFAATPSLIDSFTIFGALSGGGIFVDQAAPNVEISCNRLTGNQGYYAGGLAIGTPDTGTPSGSTDVYVHHNEVIQNGGISGAGGVGVGEGSDRFRISRNVVMGNLSRGSGGGIGVQGPCDDGFIDQNVVAFNECFFGAAVQGFGHGGGIYVGGQFAPAAGGLGDGLGDISIIGNLVQGNLAGAGSGGGICAENVNGVEAPGTLYKLSLFNNIVVNNVAAHQGGGVFLKNCANAQVYHNTIANNDCTATAALAFQAGATASDPQPAGLATSVHDALLAAAVGQSFTNPDLRNNIVLGNRSFYDDTTLGGGVGGILPNPDKPVWDLGVVGSPVPAALDPRDCILGDVTGVDPSNKTTDPVFLASYVNTLLTATVADEGGNAISVRHLNLKLGDGNYHVALTSPAKDGAPTLVGANPPLRVDVDGDSRPGALVAVGADEPTTRSRADLNDDGAVDWVDYSLLAASWGATGIGPASPNRADINGDGHVGWADYAILSAEMTL